MTLSFFEHDRLLVADQYAPVIIPLITHNRSPSPFQTIIAWQASGKIKWLFHQKWCSRCGLRTRLTHFFGSYDDGQIGVMIDRHFSLYVVWGNHGFLAWELAGRHFSFRLTWQERDVWGFLQFSTSFLVCFHLITTLVAWRLSGLTRAALATSPWWFLSQGGLDNASPGDNHRESMLIVVVKSPWELSSFFLFAVISQERIDVV